MTLVVDDTIVAVASPAGPAARGVVRLSGGDVVAVLAKKLIAGDLPALRSAKRPTWFDARFSLDDLPRGLPIRVQLWPKSSYTGQPAAELHFVGSPPLVEAVLAELIAAGARPANRGEFTLRAFLAGRLDLTQAEAVLGVIDADDAEELSTALTQLDGGLSGPLAELHEALLIDLADLEAGLDFADEDLDFVSRDEFVKRMRSAIDEIDRLVSQQSNRGRSRSADVVVLTGPPNAGKSTLLNTLCGHEAAIVSDVAGTTRDVIEVELKHGQRTVRFLDTAGIDEGDDPLVVAAEALRQEKTTEASLVLYCVPADAPVEQQTNAVKEIALLRDSQQVLHVVTKCDLTSPQACDIAVSAETQTGLAELLNTVVERLDSATNERSELIAATAARCRGSLLAAREKLNTATELLTVQAGDELVAGELRSSLDELAAVLGRVYTDDILDRVFSRFCIGK